MTISITPITVASSTFGDWVATTNLIVDAISSNAVTVGGSAAVGDAVITGNFQVDTTFTDTISGGAIGSPATLTVSSVANVSNTLIVSGGNTQLGAFNTVHITGANTTHYLLGVDSVTNKLTLNQGAPIALSGVPANGQMLRWNGTAFENTDAIVVDSNKNATFANNVILTKGVSANGSYGSNGQVLVTDGSLVYWANSTPASFAANGYFTSGSSNSNFNSGLLFVDTTNSRIGIGKTNPAYKLDVNGTINSTGLLVNGNTVWHAGNDGTGSGLDADLLDGIDSTGFIRRNVSSNTNAVVTFTAGLTANSINAVSSSLPINATTVLVTATNTGINQPVPIHTLDVNGTLRATGDVFFTANSFFGLPGATNKVGVIDLLKTTGSTLSGNTTITTDAQKIQFFENGGLRRGAFIDLSKADASIASEVWTSSSSAFSNNANGYLELPNGLAMQWGRAGSSTASGGTKAITFPAPFAAAVYNVQITSIDSNDAAIGLQSSPTTTGFTAYNDSGGTVSDFYWFAIGV